MTEQTWEFCELRLERRLDEKINKGPLKGQYEYYYDCVIIYYSPSGNVVSEQLPKLLPENKLQPTKFNPYAKAMGLLGAAGWELVSVQHGNRYWAGGGQVGSTEVNGLVWVNKSAYFKRPILPGRAVDKPKLEI